MDSLSRRTGRVAVAVGITALLATGCGGEAPEVEAGPALRERLEVSTAATAMDPHTLHRTLAGTYCSDCHVAHNAMGMGLYLLSFGPRAIAAGQPAPVYNADKTCSNVACHMVPAGEFTYWFPGGDGEPSESIVKYGGVPVTTPAWYSA
jgi:hypothetical protein